MLCSLSSGNCCEGYIKGGYNKLCLITSNIQWWSLHSTMVIIEIHFLCFFSMFHKVYVVNKLFYESSFFIE